MKTLLVIGHVWPEPNSSAAGSRMMQLLSFFLKQGYHIEFGSPTSRTPHSQDLEALGIEVVDLKLNDSSFDSFLKEIAPEIVLFDRFMTEEQFGWRVTENCPGALKILDTEDLHFLRKARQVALKQNKELSPALLFSETAKREVASIYRCDISLIISEAEMELLKGQFGVPENLLLYLPFMLKFSPEEKEELPSFEKRQHFISIGNFRHEPNWNAVLHLKQKIWPLISKQLPEAELHIYGAYPGPKVKQLHNVKERFLIKGWALSAKDVLKNSKVLLAPLQFGAGLKGKFIDAMQTATPSVTTSIGAEGMNRDLPWPGSICSKDEDFAATSVELYNDPAKWKNAQENGFKILKQNFSEEIHELRFQKKIKAVLENLDSHRNSNFTGMMLSQHLMNSTRYLAKYIEAKNALKEEK